MTQPEPLTAAPAPMVPEIYRVVSRRDDLPDTVTLTIAPRGGGCRTPTSGQFNMLWAFGVGEAPISVAGHDDGALTYTIRRVGAVTGALCSLAVGDEVGVRGPYGEGWDLGRATGRDVLVIAGGLGLAPVRPIITELFARRGEFGRAVLLVGARSPDQLLYRHELETWRSRLDIEVEVTVDVASPEWRGNVGVVTLLIDRAPIDPATTTTFVCGPEVMMRFCVPPLLDRGIPPGEVFLSLERNMHCAVGHCGHCQLGAHFVCKDGPVLAWPRVEQLVRIRER